MMETVTIESCFGLNRRNELVCVENYDHTTMISVFDGNDGYSVHVSPEDLLKLKDFVDARVRKLVLSGVISNHLGD